MSDLRKANTDFPYFITMTVVGVIENYHYLWQIEKAFRVCKVNETE
jgi:hypothetical protein